MIKIDFKEEVNTEQAREILSGIYSNKMAGWAKLPSKFDPAELKKIKETARKINSESQYLVCIGIGGSYLGHRALIKALELNKRTKIIFQGACLSRREIERAMTEIGDADFSVNVISKSGTTLEPAVVFKEFKKKLIEKYGREEAFNRIYATTDANDGALHDEAVRNGYTRFVVPDNIGGRYSVFTAVGLLPLAVAGANIDEILDGAREEQLTVEKERELSPSVQYGYKRFKLGQKGYDTEVFATAEPSTRYVNEWLKQLFGESEGKEQQGIFPAAVVYSTDLHSMGQFMQDGRRNLFETIIDYPTDELNEKIVPAVRNAHKAGGIPVLTIKVPTFDERGFGALLYFFEMACAVSATLFGVDPFDQPGVEAYKKELKQLIKGIV